MLLPDKMKPKYGPRMSSQEKFEVVKKKLAASHARYKQEVSAEQHVTQARGYSVNEEVDGVEGEDYVETQAEVKAEIKIVEKVLGDTLREQRRKLREKQVTRQKTKHL